MLTQKEIDDWYNIDGDSPFNRMDSVLYRTPYLVLPKTVILAMPLLWQKQLELLLKIATAYGFQTPDYFVTRADGIEDPYANRHYKPEKKNDI